MTRPQWLNIVKIAQAVGITLIGVFFIFQPKVYVLLLGGLVSIVASLVEWMLTYLIQRKQIRPIPLIASFLKVLVVMAIVFRGLFQDTELSLISFVILVIAIVLTLIFQLYVALTSKKRKDPNTLDN